MKDLILYRIGGMNSCPLEDNILALSLKKDGYNIVFYNAPYYSDKGLLQTTTLYDEINIIKKDIVELQKEYEIIFVAKSFGSLKIPYLLEKFNIQKAILLSPVVHIANNGNENNYGNIPYGNISHTHDIILSSEEILSKSLCIIYSKEDKLIHNNTLSILCNNTLVTLEGDVHSIEKQNIELYYDTIIKFINKE